MKWLFGRGGGAKTDKRPDYEKSKMVAAGTDAGAKAKLASDPALQPEFLYFFATDESPAVRRAVAKNPGTPIQADVILAKDPNEQVKIDLSVKVGRLLPGLSEEENRKVTDMVVEVVEILAADKQPGVRAAIAQQIRTIDTIPPRIAKRLAQDAEAVVSSPILEFSPLLTDDDLQAIIAAGCRGQALSAMARRSSLSEGVGTSIAGTEDEEALPNLLANRGSILSVETLRRIVDIAETRPSWHSALAGRRELTGGLMKRMASYISKATLDKLLKNNVLVDDTLAKTLRDTVAGNGVEGNEDLEDEEASESAGPSEADEEARARALHDRGELGAAAVMRAIKEKNREFVIHAIALLAEAGSKDVRTLMTKSDPKLAIALAWHCRLGMPVAQDLARIIMDVDGAILNAGTGSPGDYPLDEDEMAWLLEMGNIIS